MATDGDPFTVAPDRADLEAAWRVLWDADVKVIGDISVGELQRLATDREYIRSPAEMRLARSILILRAALASNAPRR